MGWSDAYLPAPESAAINRVHKILRGKHVVAVYDPGAAVGLCEVRKSFIAGACDLVEKPYTFNEINRVLAIERLSHSAR